MNEKLNELLIDEQNRGHKVEALGDNAVKVVRKDGTISRYTYNDGVIKTETMYSTPDGKPYYSETTNITVEFTGKQMDLLEGFVAKGRFLDENGNPITDKETLHTLKDEINSLSQKELKEKYGCTISTMRANISVALDTLNEDIETEHDIDDDFGEV